jgi:hypothetical protein
MIELGSGTADAAVVTSNIYVLPPIALNPLPVAVPLNDTELGVKLKIPKVPAENRVEPAFKVMPVIGVVKPVRLIVKVPLTAFVLPKNVKLIWFAERLEEPDTPAPLPQDAGGPTQKEGPGPGIEKGPVVRPFNCTAGVSLPEALMLPVRAALALPAQSRNRTATITTVQLLVPCLVLHAAVLSDRMFIPSL